MEFTDFAHASGKSSQTLRAAREVFYIFHKNPFF